MSKDFSDNKSICAYPWMAACINPNGLVRPCCFWRSNGDSLTLSNSNLTNNPTHSPAWDKVRADMVAGIPVKSCALCYKMDAANSYSGRTNSLKWLKPDDYTIFNDVKAAPLDYLEVTLSNLCNLACVGCVDGLSTKWSAENIKAGRPGAKLINNKYDWTKWDLSTLRKLKILGGEPFMEQDRFGDLLEHVDLAKLTLVIFTNGTILPDERLKSLIEKSKKVEFYVSLDGLGSVNDWVRWPGKFNEVVDNMKIFQSWWSNYTNIELINSSVINIFNILTIDSYFDFMTATFPNWRQQFNWVDSPDWQDIKNLPKEVKSILINNYSSKTADNLRTLWEKDKDFYKISSEYLKLSGNVDWNFIKTKTNNLAKERNLDIDAMIPEFKKILDNY